MELILGLLCLIASGGLVVLALWLGCFGSSTSPTSSVGWHRTRRSLDLQLLKHDLRRNDAAIRQQLDDDFDTWKGTS